MVDMLLKRRIRLLPDPSFFNNVMSLISAPKVRPENQPPLSDPKQVSRLEPQTRKPAPKKLLKTLKNFEYPLSLYQLSQTTLQGKHTSLHPHL